MAAGRRSATVSDMAPKILILYASTHGQTAKIADRIGATLGADGAQAEVRAVGDAPADIAGYDGVIVGASVHAGKHQSEILDWLGVHWERLNELPSAFFSVSLAAADDTDEAREATREIIEDVPELTGWTPHTTTAIAGALQFSKYNLATRVLMRLIARRHEPAADLHHDTEYTDWDAVERFAHAFAQTVTAAAAPAG